MSTSPHTTPHTTHHTTRQLRHSPDQLAALANGIAEHGFACHASEAVGLANLLGCEGIRHVAIDVVLDEIQPEVARERAFGLVHGLALEAPRLARTVAA